MRTRGAKVEACHASNFRKRKLLFTSLIQLLNLTYSVSIQLQYLLRVRALTNTYILIKLQIKDKCLLKLNQTTQIYQ